MRSRRSATPSRRPHARADRRPGPARPARDQPPDRGGPRRIARGPRRPGRRRGAAGDPRRRAAPGPGRGRGHDADARATRPSSRSASSGRRACSTARRCSARAAATRASLEPAGRHDRGPPVAAVRRLDGRRAPFRRHGLVRDLRQGLDRRGRAADRPAAGRPGGLALGHPRPAGPAARGPARLRRDRRPPRGRPVHPGRRAPRASARTSGATTRSTSSSARRCWPARCRSTIGS